MKLVVTVVGVDRVGIIAGVSTVLANYGVNIMSIIIILKTPSMMV